MANQKQTLEVVRNIIVELDKEIRSASSVIEMIKTHPDYKDKYQPQAILDWESHLRTLKNLRQFVIYKS